MKAFDQQSRITRQIRRARPKAKPRVSHDVLIVGAGLIGATIAWLLSKAGCSVLLIDAGEFGGEASSAAAGMLAPGGEYHRPAPAARFAMESLAMYPVFVRQLEQESGLPIDYRNCGAIDLAYSQEHWRALQHRAEVQRSFGIPVHVLCPSSLDAMAAGLNVSGLFGGLHYPNEACVSPTDLLRVLRILCDRSGVKILENSPVETITAERDQSIVRFKTQQITGRNLVLAAGAWSSTIPMNRLGTSVSIPRSVPIKGHLLAFALPAGSLRPILRAGHYYVVQRKSGFTIAGSSEERCGFNRSLSTEQTRQIRKQVSAFYTPVLKIQPIQEWFGFRPGLERQGPVICRVPKTTVWLAYGHYRNGVLLAPATAHLVADEILGYAKQSEEDWRSAVGFGEISRQQLGIG